MRVKETAADYRYIPDPDIPPQQLQKDFVSKILLPETPQTRRKRLVEEYSIPADYAKILVSDKDLADLFEEVSKKADSKLAAQWICGEVLRQLNYRSIELRESKLNDKIIAELMQLLQDNTITENVGKKLIERVIDSGESPKQVVETQNLKRISDVSTLYTISHNVMANNPQPVRDYLNGEKKAVNYLMGQVMKETGGSATPDQVILTLTSTLSEFEKSGGSTDDDSIARFMKKKITGGH